MMLAFFLTLSAAQPTQSLSLVETPATEEWRAEGFAFRSRIALKPDVKASLAEQAALIAEQPLKAEVLQFFRAQRLVVVPNLGEAGSSGPNGIALAPVRHQKSNPVLFHELLHLYHQKQLTGGEKNPVIADAFRQAGTVSAWRGTYMMSDQREFFAMTASAVVLGRVGRHPFTASAVKKALPAYYEWLRTEFIAEAGERG